MRSLMMTIWLMGALITGLGLYGIAYEVEQMERELAALEREIRQERNNIHVLEAEWTYLARPERIEKLSGQFLPNMQVLTAQRIGEYDDLPYRPLPNVMDVLQPEKLAPAPDAKVKK